MENPSAFPMGEPNDGFAQYFVGQSYLAPVLETPQIAIHNVTFEPGCRNNWHIHHNAAQVLIAVGGRGYYQIEGQEPKELKAGQAVCIPADTKHWHGAAPGESCSHLAFMVPAGDPASMSNEWLEPVDAEAYGKLARGLLFLYGGPSCKSGMALFVVQGDNGLKPCDEWRHARKSASRLYK